MTGETETKRQRTRLWGVVVAASVAGLLAVAGGITIWRGPGVLQGGGSGSTCAGSLTVGSAGLFGDYFENHSDHAAVLHSIRYTGRSNVRVVADTVIDHTTHSGIGAGEFPLRDSLFRSTLRRSKPLDGYVVGPGQVVQVVMKVYPLDSTLPGRMRSAIVEYTESGKPFTYEAVNTEELGVRSKLAHGHC